MKSGLAARCSQSMLIVGAERVCVIRRFDNLQCSVGKREAVMAVEKLDLRSIWEGGKTYAAWLEASTNARLKEDLEKSYSEVKLSPDDSQLLKLIDRPVHVLALAEDWCGDVRRNTPVVAKMCAEKPDLLRLRVVDKETRPQLMVRYLTNGAEAIPIIVFLNDAFVEVGYWGPRPAECKRLMARGKAAGKIDDARERIHAFYTKDQHLSTIRELRGLFTMAAAKEV